MVPHNSDGPLGSSSSTRGATADARAGTKRKHPGWVRPTFVQLQAEDALLRLKKARMLDPELVVPHGHDFDEFFHRQLFKFGPKIMNKLSKQAIQDSTLT